MTLTTKTKWENVQTHLKFNLLQTRIWNKTAPVYKNEAASLCGTKINLVFALIQDYDIQAIRMRENNIYVVIAIIRLIHRTRHK